MYRMIGIDPGLNGTGVAILRGNTLAGAFCIHPPKKEPWLVQIRFIQKRLQEALFLPGPGYEAATVTGAMVELPEFWGGASRRGMVSASSQALIKLSILTGSILAILPDTIEPHHATANQWKGNLSKATIALRIRKRVKEGYLDAPDVLLVPTLKNEHITHALGMALYAKGKL